MEEEKKRALYFTSFTFLFSWSLVLIFYSLGGKWGSLASTIISILYMAMPLLAAVFVEKYYFKGKIKQRLGLNTKPNIWWLIAWILPLCLLVTTVAINASFPSITFSIKIETLLSNFSELLTQKQLNELETILRKLPINPIYLFIFQGLFAGLTINAVVALGEEAGWRGFLFDALKKRNFWTTSLIIGVIWGTWHAPIILQGHNYPQHPYTGVIMMIIWTTLLSPIFNLIRIKGYSTLAAAIFHGTINALGGIPILVVTGGNDLINGLTGVSGFTALIIINTLIFIFYYRKETIKDIMPNDKENNIK